MIHLLCIICPPLAVLSCGKPISAILNVILTCFFWIPGVIHAFAVVGSANADRRNRHLIGAINANNPIAQGNVSPSKSMSLAGGIFFVFVVLIAISIYQPVGSKTKTVINTELSKK